MDDIIERFFQVKRAKGVSPRTEVSYRETLGQFLGHYLSTDPTRTLQDVRSDDIVGFLVHLRDLGRGENTRANRYRTLRNFFNWCRRERLIKVNPVKGVQNPVVHPEAVKPYTRNEIDRMMAATRRRPPQALRDQAVVALLYNTGMRAGDALERQSCRDWRYPSPHRLWFPHPPSRDAVFLEWQPCAMPTRFDGSSVPPSRLGLM